MRAALWILSLLVLFATAWLVQARWREAAARELGRAELRPLDQGWSRALVGRPSGVEPVDVPPRAVPQAPSEDSPAVEAPRAPSKDTQTNATAAARHVVTAGQTLASICALHYGSKKKDVVAALARFNGLADANSLRVGQTLLVPRIEDLPR